MVQICSSDMLKAVYPASMSTALLCKHLHAFAKQLRHLRTLWQISLQESPLMKGSVHALHVVEVKLIAAKHDLRLGELMT